MSDLPEPVTREEKYLASIAGENTELPEPVTRAELYLSKIAGQDTGIPAEPITRIEQYLAYIAEHGSGGSSFTDADVGKVVVKQGGSADESYDISALIVGDSIASGTVLFDGALFTVTAMQNLNIRSSFYRDDNGETALLSSSASTSVSLNGADAKSYRIGVRIEAKAEITVTLESFALAGKIIALASGGDGEYTAEGAALCDNSDGVDGIPVNLQAAMSAGETRDFMGQGTNAPIYAIYADSTASGGEEDFTLQAQTSLTVTRNGTYDTTVNNAVTVDVATELKLQSKSVNIAAGQTIEITPDEGFDGFSSLTVIGPKQ